MATATRPSEPSVGRVRSRFAALGRAQSGMPVAYFDGPGGTQVPDSVARAMSDYLLHNNANTHWDYPTSRETDAALDSARTAIADFLGGARDEVAFGANMTTLTFHLSRALGRELSPGATVLVTELDHHANVAPWRVLAAERGLRVRCVRLDPEAGRLDDRDFEARLSEGPAVVAFGAASNVLGTINDVARWVDAAHEVGALTFVDAVHYAAHAPIDVAALGCDFLACSAYKFYGPHVGVLWGRRALLERLDLPRLDPAPQDAPERAETGTQNHEGIVGAAAAVEFLAGLAGSAGPRRDRLRRSYEWLEARSATLGGALRAGLRDVPGVSVHGPRSGPSTPTVSFVVEGRDARDVCRWLADERALYLSHGDFYAPTVIERFGSPAGGFIRAGCACYTTEEEVERLVRAVEELATRQRGS